LAAVARSDAEAEDKVRLGVHTLVAALADDPAMARVILVEAVGATPEIERARQAARAGFSALIKGEMRRFEGWQGASDEEISIVALATMAAVAETVSHLVATDGLKDPGAAAGHLAAYALRALTPPD
ncbi:MAG: hypothetical protein QOG68_1494, partial [Solirubrobacteraceae bacterium]|nr:hypothetical protein [Solirubrobacteraceae bacterium]